MIHRTAKVSDELNRKCPARSMTVQLITPDMYPECHSAQWHRDVYRQSDRHHHQLKIIWYMSRSTAATLRVDIELPLRWEWMCRH